jgi:8-oxo-dGTP pyrophosphatase MutT (NUDIX family)
VPPDRTASLVAALLRHEPCDERESSSLSEVLDGLRTLAHPFDESADFVHITGSAVVISPAGVLLHRHKRLGIWLQPGGHVDAGETPAETAVR